MQSSTNSKGSKKAKLRPSIIDNSFSKREYIDLSDSNIATQNYKTQDIKHEEPDKTSDMFPLSLMSDSSSQKMLSPTHSRYSDAAPKTEPKRQNYSKTHDYQVDKSESESNSEPKYELGSGVVEATSESNEPETAEMNTGGTGSHTFEAQKSYDFIGAGKKGRNEQALDVPVCTVNIEDDSNAGACMEKPQNRRDADIHEETIYPNQQVNEVVEMVDEVVSEIEAPKEVYKSQLPLQLSTDVKEIRSKVSEDSPTTQEVQIEDPPKLVFQDISEEESKVTPKYQDDNKPSSISTPKENLFKTITFKIIFPTVFGQELNIVGSHEKFGHWDTKEGGLAFKWNNGNIWTLTMDKKHLPQRSEFKFILKNDDGSVQWEDRENRAFDQNIISYTLRTNQKMKEDGYALIDQRSTKLEHYPSHNNIVLTHKWNE